ncbi:MBL fold metallo-hydrolase [Microbacterium trichothecenolyticum]|uniref:MBL fold metallo-hydrolase n=1 Tax=Microbacterium trichothecenolyticum TaxID=69370 RepID=UPI00358F4575
MGARTLTKTTDSFLDPTQIGQIDAVLLSHDQHPDNLNRLGRKYVEDSTSVTLTTSLAASRLSGHCRGLRVWEQTRAGDTTVTAVPAQHGPDGTEHLTGPVIGFVLESVDGRTVYISGDNASLAAVEDIAARFPVVDLGACLPIGWVDSVMLGQCRVFSCSRMLSGT